MHLLLQEYGTPFCKLSKVPMINIQSAEGQQKEAEGGMIRPVFHGCS